MRRACAARAAVGQAATVGAILAAIGRATIDYALPARCPGCGAIVEADHRFCATCWRGLDFLIGPACAGCGEPFARDFGADALCAACLARPPACAPVRAAVSYGEAARAVALKLKHRGGAGTAETMARAIARALGNEAAGALIAPVPLHRWRLWARGHNQAALLARALGRRCEADYVADLLERTRRTPLLRGLGRKERATAVRGAFRVPARYRAALKGRRVLLVDDVYTTGATANACAAALLRAGAAQVGLACWARVVRGDEAEAPGARLR